MVKTRGMASNGRRIVNEKKIVRVKSKATDKVHSKKIRTKNQCASVEELMKLCRPLTVSLRRFNLFDISNKSVYTPKRKVQGKILR